MHQCSCGSKGAQGSRPPPLGQFFFIFMHFSRKIGQIVGWRPPLGLADPLWEILDPPLQCITLEFLETSLPMQRSHDTLDSSISAEI